MTGSDKPADGLHVALLGNLDPNTFWSTEWEYAHAWEEQGARVSPFLEQDPAHWRALIDRLRRSHDYDLIHWTSTKSFRDNAGTSMQWEMTAARSGTPVIAVHLDRWQGLGREHLIIDDPYFRAVDLAFTADGDAEEMWAAADIDHHWLLPAIGRRWLGLGEHRDEYDCDVVFVGGWDGYGHREWTHRADLVEHLTKWYGDRFLALPRRGQPRIVGRDLNDVYASAKVVVGDSCLVPHSDGRPKARYCSDRIPETLGRGGMLFHPAVEGININPFLDPFVTAKWELGDWATLRAAIDANIDLPEHEFHGGSRRAAMQTNVDRIAAAHTYHHRVAEIVAVMKERGLL